ncbi:hypothetical protein [Cellulomonas hominis]
MQPTDLCPVLHRDHPPRVQEGVKFHPSHRGQFSRVVDTLTRFHGTGNDFGISLLAAGQVNSVEDSWTSVLTEQDPAGPITPAPLEYYPGPRPFYVVDVETSKSIRGQDSATVYGCGIDGWSVSDPLDVPRDATQQEPMIWTYDLTRVSDTRIQVAAGGSVARHDGKSAAELCDTSRVRLGFFDPPPPYGEPVLPWEVLDNNGQPATDFDPELAARATGSPTPAPIGDGGEPRPSPPAHRHRCRVRRVDHRHAHSSRVYRRTGAVTHDRHHLASRTRRDPSGALAAR